MAIKTIPKDIASLKGILRARKWEKAAYVWAFCSPQSGTSSENRRGAKFTIREFAELGITGLTHHETVSLYWNAWNDALVAGYVKPTKPGAEFEVPTLDWPFGPVGSNDFNRLTDDQRAEYERVAAEEGTTASQIARYAGSVPALRAAIKADPKVAIAAGEALRESIAERRAKIEANKQKVTCPGDVPDAEKTSGPQTMLGMMMLVKLSTDIEKIEEAFTGSNLPDSDERTACLNIITKSAERLLAVKSLILDGSVSDQAEDFLKSLG